MTQLVGVLESCADGHVWCLIDSLWSESVTARGGIERRKK